MWKKGPQSGRTRVRTQSCRHVRYMSTRGFNYHRSPSSELEDDTLTETESTLSLSASSQPGISDTESDLTASWQEAALTPQTGDTFTVKEDFMKFLREISDDRPDSLRHCIAGLLFFVFVSVIVVTVYSRRPPPCNWWCRVQSDTTRVLFPAKSPF